MSKREAFWDSVPWAEGDDGMIRWPETHEERVSLARSMVGAKLVGAMEAILEEHLEVVSGVPPQPGAHDYEKAAAERAIFASLSGEQRQTVERVVASACFGTLYWTLVKLRSFPGGTVDLVVSPLAPDDSPLPDCPITEMELHYHYFDWVERFANHKDPK